jgi:hypothetical protein
VIDSDAWLVLMVFAIALVVLAGSGYGSAAGHS